MLVEAVEDEDFECTGRAAHQAPEVDGECVLERGSGLAVGDLVRAGRRHRGRRPARLPARAAAAAAGSPPARRPGVRGELGAGGPAAAAEHRQRRSPVSGCCWSRCSWSRCSPRTAPTPAGGWPRSASSRVAALTDRFDGELARSRGLVTAFGTIADPIADKALTGSALVGLSLLGLVPWWVTIVIMGREIGRHAAAVLGAAPRGHPGQPRRQGQDARAGARHRALPAAAAGRSVRRRSLASLRWAVLARRHRAHRRHRAGLRAAGVAAAGHGAPPRGSRPSRS